MITETLSALEAVWTLFALIATLISLFIIGDAILDLVALNNPDIAKLDGRRGRKLFLARGTIIIECMTLAKNLLFLAAGVISGLTLPNPSAPPPSPVVLIFIIIIILNAARSVYSYYVRRRLS